jgi:hypothetical protein
MNIKHHWWLLSCFHSHLAFISESSSKSLETYVQYSFYFSTSVMTLSSQCLLEESFDANKFSLSKLVIQYPSNLLQAALPIRNSSVFWNLLYSTSSINEKTSLEPKREPARANIPYKDRDRRAEWWSLQISPRQLYATKPRLSYPQSTLSSRSRFLFSEWCASCIWQLGTVISCAFNPNLLVMNIYPTRLEQAYVRQPRIRTIEVLCST